MITATKATAIACAVALGAFAGTPALAQHWGGPRVGLYVGVPLYAPYYPPAYYGYPYGYPPAAYAPPAAPIVYSERGDQPAPAQPMPQSAASDWYFCPDSNGYYPYVRSCASGWQRVPAQPPGPTR